MKKAQLQITNKLGLHARAAAKVVHAASSFECEIFIGTEHEEVNAKSILGLLTLAATRGTTVAVRADGMDEESAIQELVTLFNSKFGEPE